MIADPETMIWGGELVLRDGVAVGQVTSGAWGETLGGCVGLAYVRHPEGEILTPDLIRAGGQHGSARVGRQPRGTRRVVEVVVGEQDGADGSSRVDDGLEVWQHGGAGVDHDRRVGTHDPGVRALEREGSRVRRQDP